MQNTENPIQHNFARFIDMKEVRIESYQPDPLSFPEFADRAKVVFTDSVLYTNPNNRFYLMANQNLINITSLLALEDRLVVNAVNQDFVIIRTTFAMRRANIY